MSATVALLETTYRETYRLIEEARTYATSGKARDMVGLNQSEQLTLTIEALRITTRLTNVMSWLMARKAIHAGEMTMEEVKDRGLMLGGQSLCLEEGALDKVFLSERLKDLMLRSLDLYQRVDRLDRGLRGDLPTLDQVDDPEGRIVPFRRPSAAS